MGGKKILMRWKQSSSGNWSMCGICGILKFEQGPVEEAQIRRMCNTFVYRGPDDEGVYIGQAESGSNKAVYVGLGHRRLSIMDLSEAGHQPMCNEDGTVWISYNGEIYNYNTIREDLETKGHVFHSRSDTEVLLHLYEEEGPDAIKLLNGMFAFAVWDKRRGRLWLCRDRLGIKPLVYYYDGKLLAFASEIKALLALPDISKRIDHHALQLYLAFSYIPAPHTIFEGIQKLLPGSQLLLENGHCKISKFWELPKTTEARWRGRRWPEIKDEVLPLVVDTVTNAVSDRMIADVPLGAFLSGGIDSSIVVAMMVRQSSERVKTFSIGFEGEALFDETEYARAVSKMYATEHHEFKLTPSDMQAVLENVLGAFDEPFSDSSAIPMYIVSRETRRFVTVALSGDGGDELFAGYRSYLAWFWYDRYMRIPEILRQDVFERILNHLPDSREKRTTEFIRRAQKFSKGTKGDFVERLLHLKELSPFSLRSQLAVPVNSDLSDRDDPARAWLDGLLACYNGDHINRVLYTDTCDSLPGDMLNKVDWMSMQNSLEVRVPLLDYRVAELAFRIPGPAKMYRGRTKSILKEAFRPFLPNGLYRRPKAGFEVPISRWLRSDLSFLIDRYLNVDRIKKQQFFNHETINGLAKQFTEGKKDHSWILWNLIVFQYWYDGYFQ